MRLLKYQDDEKCIGMVKEDGSIVHCSKDSSTNDNAPEKAPTYNRKPHWKSNDILLFYKALSFCGANFTLMERYFQGKRTRKQLLARFKLEQKIRPDLIAKAMLSKTAIGDDFLSK